jgi:hypothetical protein
VPISPRAGRWWLLAAGTLIGLALCELGLRVRRAADERQQLAEWRALGKTTYTGEGPVQLGHLIRPHANARIVYDLIPGLSLPFRGAVVTTNADGFRGPRYPREPEAGTVRIVGLGDSFMFGWGVGDREGFLPVLEELLEARYPDTRFEAVNTAVPGYNTVMQLETLRQKGLAWHPDVVVIDYVSNDLSLPNFIAPESQAWSPARSFVVDALRSALGGTSESGDLPLVQAPRNDEDQFELDPERVPAAYRGMVGLDAWRAAMRELGALSRQHGFSVVVSSHLRPPEHLREICAELGFPLVEVLPRLERAARERGAADRISAGLALSAEDPHPTAPAHRMQAEELLRCLEETGILERAMARGAER